MELNKTELFGLYISYGQGLDFSVLAGRKGYHCFLNSHMLYEYHVTGALKNSLDSEKANIYPDGVPTLQALRRIAKKSSDRIAGNDVMYALVDYAAVNKLKIFLIGGAQDTLDRVGHLLSKRGVDYFMNCPPFAPIEQFDFEKQSQLIKEYDPDLVLVGLGCPKQEQWMYQMRNRVKCPMFGLGGAFALFAGVDIRAPLWMRNMSLEWLYRLALEPRRLWKRYLLTNSYFIYLLLREFWRVRIRRTV